MSALSWISAKIAISPPSLAPPAGGRVDQDPMFKMLGSGSGNCAPDFQGIPQFAAFPEEALRQTAPRGPGARCGTADILSRRETPASGPSPFVKESNRERRS